MNLTKRVPIRENPDWAVWRGELTGARRLYVVKEANPKSPYAPQLATRLADEYRFLAALDHPHLVKPLWADQNGLRAAFSDAQCSLTQYVAAHGRITPTLVANVLLMAVDALDYLHGRRLGHGCVNAHTLLVGPAGDVRFGDFLGYEFGTNSPLPVPDPEPRYQAPELIDGGLGRPGPQSDLYCLGYLALELLAGDRFEALFGVPDGANWLAWHADPYKQLVDWQPVLAHAPAGLTDIIAGLLPKRPTDRAFATAAELKAALVRSRLTSDQRLPPYRPAGLEVPAEAVTIRRPPARKRAQQTERRPGDKPALVLTSLADPTVTRTFAPAAPVLLGAGRKCDLRCPGAGVSQKHALLACGPDGAWRVFDLNTAASTWVNGAPVRRAALHPEDHLHLGECGFSVGFASRSGGRAFDEFRLVELLHQGARGRVYRGVWGRKQDREVAVHLFPRDFQFHGGGLRRLLRGLTGVSGLRHQHLVRALRAGAERVGGDRVWFQAFEYMPGGSLRDRLRAGGRLSPGHALRVARHAARGAAALTEAGWVHRNINPGCVLFGSDERARLGDFYYARPVAPEAAGEVTTLGAVEDQGDLAYRAPECLMGDAATPAADVYSLGATLYEALTGRPAVDPNGLPSEVTARAMARPARGPRERLPKLPAAVDALVRRAMARDPGERFPNPAAFEAAINALARTGTPC
ncbi:MAG: protein kinase domain-containing protein [Gemmata sp.]